MISDHLRCPVSHHSRSQSMMSIEASVWTTATEICASSALGLDHCRRTNEVRADDLVFTHLEPYNAFHHFLVFALLSFLMFPFHKYQTTRRYALLFHGSSYVRVANLLIAQDCQDSLGVADVVSHRPTTFNFKLQEIAKDPPGTNRKREVHTRLWSPSNTTNTLW